MRRDHYFLLKLIKEFAMDDRMPTIPDFIDRARRLRKIAELEENGELFIDKEHTYIEQNVSIGAGTLVYPNVFIFAGSILGTSCVLFPGTKIFESNLGNRVIIHHARVTRASIGDGTE